jgi:hypothetical protein
MPGLGFLDVYTVRARLFPAIIAAAPAIALAAVFVFWESFHLQGVIATLALAVLLFVLSDVARRRGKAIEPRLIKSAEGLPSITMLRHRDATFDAASKARVTNFVGAKLGEAPPTAADERRDPDSADEFYRRCGNWLREHTRDKKQFGLLFEENVTYGFRRNLLGLKLPGLILNAAIVVSCITLIWATGLSAPLTQKLLPVLVISVLHALYLALMVSESSVQEASRQYARQLFLSSESLRSV